jgi:hypothetical protein
MTDNMKAYEALSRAYLLLKEPVRAHFCARMSRRLASRLGDEGGVSQADVLLASMGKQVTYPVLAHKHAHSPLHGVHSSHRGHTVHALSTASMHSSHSSHCGVCAVWCR